MKHVPYDIALKLREKGFKRRLDPAGNLIGYNLSWEDKSNISYYHVHTQFPSDKEFLFAPSYQDVVDWFLTEHNIFLEVLVFNIGSIEENKFSFQWRIYNNSEEWETIFKEFKTPNEALKSAIEEALNLI